MVKIKTQIFEEDVLISDSDENASMGQEKMCSELTESYLEANPRQQAMTRVELKPAMMRIPEFPEFFESNDKIKPAVVRVPEFPIINATYTTESPCVREGNNTLITVNKEVEAKETLSNIPKINSSKSCNYLDSKEIIKPKNQINLEDDKRKQFFSSTEGYLCVKINQEIILISNFSVIPEKILIIDDGLNKETVYKVTCILNNDGERKIISLFSNELNNSNWVKNHLGIKYYLFEDINAYKYLDIFISQQFKRIKEEVEFIQVGWRFINYTWVYLHAGGAIGLMDKSIKGSKDKLIEVDRYMTKDLALRRALTLLDIGDYSKTLPLFLYSHLAIMKEVFSQSKVNIQFMLWIVGLTGSRKTTIGKLFFNLFNRNKDYITATFKDTVAAIEMKSFEYKDTVLLLDDYHPSSSLVEKNEMNHTASEVVRRYGDGICRARANKNMQKQKEFPPRGLCVITGEDTYGGQSTVSRYIRIELASNDINLEKLSYHQQNPFILSTHMYYFIEWVSHNFQNIVKYISQNFTIRRSQNPNLFNHGRLTDAFFIYQLQIEIFFKYCVETGILKEEQKQENEKHWQDVIFQVIKNHELSNISQDPAIMYLMALQELVGSNKCKVIKKGETLSERNIGYKDEKRLYLVPKLTFPEVRSFWKSQGQEFPISEERANEALDVLGVIEVKMEGKTKRRTIKISGDSRRFLVIDIERMNEVLKNIE